MTPSTTQLSFSSAIQMFDVDHVTMFDVDHVTMVETRTAFLTVANNCCSELRNLCQTSTLVPST